MSAARLEAGSIGNVAESLMAPSKPRHIRGDDVKRFASKTIAMANGCVEWTATLTRSGYGKFMTGPHRGQTTWMAHRWAYWSAHGAVPPLLRHRCDNPKCVNVEHLEPGTQHDNVHDAMNRGRRKVSLDESMVRSLRSARSAGGSVRAEAARLGVKYMTAYQAAVGNTWRHVK